MLSNKAITSILIIAVAVFLTIGGTALAQEIEELEDANVFIEHGAIIIASVLNDPLAIVAPMLRSE